ncbi:hypothetical protein IFM89_017060 [Coptis chinensis]|uniref:Uncharacterized protein n=1 Tax=Coptis chinensis TaxID=261450 RepID=A0A835HKR7_9MAGN|nr:hypothetical protein IFM89_017060 [Coptis chinensis]
MSLVNAEILFLIPLLAQVNEHAKLSMLRNATRLYQIFAGGSHSLLSNRQSRPALPALEQLIHLSDEEVQMHVGHYLICLMARMTKSSAC